MALRLKGLKGTKGRAEQRQGVFRGLGRLSQQAFRGFDYPFVFFKARSHISQTGLYNSPACTFCNLGLQAFTSALVLYGSRVEPRASCMLSK